MYSSGDPTSAAAALLLPCVKSQLLLCPEVTYEPDVILPDLSFQRLVQPGEVTDEHSFTVEVDTYLPTIRSHGEQVAFVTIRVEEPPKLLREP